MKTSKFKKVLSSVLATAMLISAVPAMADGDSTATAVNYAANANDATISSSRIAISGFTGANFNANAAHNNSSGFARLYKLTNVFGLGEDESAIEVTARENRYYQPYLMYNPTSTISTSQDFYITTNVYIGDQREDDLFRMSGQYTANGTENKTLYKFFRGTGEIFANTETHKSIKCEGTYAKDNWVRQTLAYDSTARKMSLYFDDVLWATSDVADCTELSVGGIGVRMDYNNTIYTDKATDFGGTPSYFLLKDGAVKTATYTPADSSTEITTSASDITVTYAPIVKGSATKAKVEVALASGASYTAGDLKAKLNAPTDGSLSIVKIEDDSKATLAVEDSANVSDTMKVLVKAKDGAMKLYDISVPDEIPTLKVDETAPSAYTVDNDKNAVTICDATAATLKTRILADNAESYKVVNAYGTEVDDSTFIDESMKIVAVKGEKSVEYSITISNPVVFNPTGTIESLDDDTVLFAGSGETLQGNVTVNYANTLWGNVLNAGLSNAAYAPLYGFNVKDNQSGGMSAVNATSETETVTAMYKVSKTTMSGKPAYHFEYNPTITGGWMHVGTSQNFASSYPSVSPSKTILSFNVKAANVYSSFAVEPHHKAGNSGIGSKGDGTNSDTVWFNNGSIEKNQMYVYFKSYVRSDKNQTKGGVASTIDNKNFYVTAGTEYNITLVEKTQVVYTDNNTTSYKVVVDGIYVNGQKLDNSEYSYDITNVDSNKVYENLWRDLRVSFKGDVTVSDFKLYLVDDYNPNAVSGDDGESSSPSQASLVITSDSLTVSGKTIAGWSGMTVDQLKNAIDTQDSTAQVEVMNADNTRMVTGDSYVESNMLFVVSDPYYSNNVEYYTLVGGNHFTNYVVTEETEGEGDDQITKIKVHRQYIVYDKTEDLIEARMIFASYDSNGNLINVQVATTKPNNPGDWNLVASLPKGADSYKVFLWDTNTQAPMDSVFTDLSVTQ